MNLTESQSNYILFDSILYTLRENVMLNSGFTDLISECSFFPSVVSNMQWIFHYGDRFCTAKDIQGHWVKISYLNVPWKCWTKGTHTQNIELCGGENDLKKKKTAKTFKFKKRCAKSKVLKVLGTVRDPQQTGQCSMTWGHKK